MAPVRDAEVRASSVDAAMPSRPTTATRLDLPLPRLPLALARLHLAMAVGDGLEVEVPAAATTAPTDGAHGAAGAGGAGEAQGVEGVEAVVDALVGAGFEAVSVEGRGPILRARATRALSLPDTVGPGMRLLVCGLNPSVYAAERGVGYARPGNRFWPAALAAGLVTRSRDPLHALTGCGVGLTDLVKRATARAADLDRDEYRAGRRRVERLVGRLRPGAVCFVGLEGWRVAVDRRATAGPQALLFGGRPAYVMPSTSGLNGHASLAELTRHLAAAARLPG